MTFKYNNVYLNDVSSVAGKMEFNGPLGNYYDLVYNDLYLGTKSWEIAESKMIVDSFNILLNKLNKKIEDIDLRIGGDLVNQMSPTHIAGTYLDIPFIGAFGACSTSCLGLIIGSNFIENKQINSCIVTSSSHNNSAEKTYRYPIEYGNIKRSLNSFTVTGAGSFLISNSKSKIKIESSTIGKIMDLGITDASDMGAIMVPSAAYTIYTHLKELNRDINYYDLILTGDLGKYGKQMLIDYMKEEYNMELKKYNDAGCFIYNYNKQKVFAGGSGAGCLPLVFNSFIYSEMLKGKYKKVLLVATGALISTSMINLHLSLPSISHAISLEVLD